MLSLFWDEATYNEETTVLRDLAQRTKDALILGVDLAAPAQAAVDVLRARRNGVPVLVHCVGSDPLEAMLARVSAQIVANTDAAARRTQLAALRDGRLSVGGVPFTSSAPVAREVAIAAHFIMSMADTVGFFTDGEIVRWTSMFGRPLRRISYFPTPDCPATQQHEGITVFAPSTPRMGLGFVAAALEAHGRSATFITAENPGQRPNTSVVVTPEWWRPARALALARAGFSVVSPSRAAVATRMRVFEYSEFSTDSFGAALDAAAGGHRAGALWEPAPVAVAETMPIQGPLVSIIVRTYDRPALLARAIDSIVRQTYSCIEVVVVNNGGPDVGDLVARSCGERPFRYVPHPERSTISTASNLGARAASGAYIGYLDDDDLLYPDHVARAVEVLERTGADVSYSDSVGEYAVIENERKSVLGVGIYLDREFSREALYASNFAPIHSIVHRRDVFDRFGFFNETLPVTDDWDLWLRVAHGGTFVHVGRPTCEYSWRIDPKTGNMTARHQQDFVDCYKRITGHWASEVGSREEIRAAQVQTLAMQERKVTALQADPSSAFNLLLAPLLQNAVPVQGLLDETLRRS